jgi:hypothetical protein
MRSRETSYEKSVDTSVFFFLNPVYIPRESGDKLRSLVSTTKEVQGDKGVKVC